MPWPLSRRLAGKDGVVAIQVIRHLQTQVALQQLAKEIYSTAMSMAASNINTGDQVWVRDIASVVKPGLAEKYLLPAAEKTVNVAETMVAEHRAFYAVQKPKKALEAYDKWADFLAVFLARARLLLACWKDWVDNPSLELSERASSLDQVEDSSMTVSLNVLHDLIRRAGLEGEPWLSINCAAFNEVRSRIGLPPLTEPDFRARLHQGVAGGRVRFFD